MAKTKVKKLSDVPKTESKNIYHMSTSSYTWPIDIYNMKVTGNSTYIVDSNAGGDKNHYRLDYSSLIPKGGSCKAYAMRDGDDLIFVAKISNGSKIVKTVTTTFQNYYYWSTAHVVHIDNKWAEGSYEYWFDGSNRYYEWGTDELRFNPYSTEPYNPYTYMSGYITDKDANRIAGSKKADIYNLAYNDSYVYDEAGNDKYMVSNATSPTIYDYAGNDVYTATAAYADIYDYKGDDTYISYSEGQYGVIDYAGNDNYQVYNSVNDTSVVDYAGNDKYKVMESSDGTYIYDIKGNDSYDITRAQYVGIEDEAGNDKYTISSSYPGGSDLAETKIIDYKGKDTYNITDVDRLFITDGESGTKNSGNDKYNLTRVINTGSDISEITDYSGNDKYNLHYCNYLEITDENGSDKYTITDNSMVERINDAAGNDTYIISNGSEIDDYISDLSGKDKYTVSNNSFANIQDKGSENDTYSVFGNSEAILSDEGGKDTYNIDFSSYARIDDRAGKDTLNILGAKADDLVFMVNYNTKTPIQKNDVSDGSLFIFNKSTGAYIEIENYFNTRTDTSGNNYINGNDIGYIENIKAGKKSMNSVIAEYATAISGGVHADALGNAVAEWLSNNSYSTDTYTSISSIMNSSIADEFIATFVAAQ